MPERRDPLPEETGVPGAGAPGALSRLLLEIAEAPAGELERPWSAGLREGDRVGRYAIRQEIGRGGFGAVHEAFDPELGRLVALKALQPRRARSELSQAWIQREAEAIAKLDHPAIVSVFDVGTCPAGGYLVMERLQGETLAERIEKGALPADEALRVAEQMAEGLAHAHSRGVLHRDLKPSNVFLCADGRVKLLDFGLAHLLGSGASSSGGTPAYMAPEQARGEPVDERADVYAAGMVLGEMLTGKRPPGPTAQAHEPSLDDVPRPAARIVKAALSMDPDGRPRNGAAWLSALRAVRRVMDRPRRARRVAVLAGVGVAAGLAVAGFATWRIWERQIPGGRPTVAVADFANETGEPELDGLSGLLITALEQGTQLRVLTRGRMLDVLKQRGKRDVERIDEPMAREVGVETRANALLLATVRRLGASYVVEMRALDPLHDEYLFTVSERATGKDALFALVDRLGSATRKRLGVGGAPDDPPPPPIAEITTDDLKAWELLSGSRRAFDRDDLKEAQRLAEAAVAEHPDLPLARYQLAVTTLYLHRRSRGDKADVLRPVEAAERMAARLPEKERLSLQAIRAQLESRWADATRLWDKAVLAYPQDKDILLQAGDVRLQRFQFGSAIPYYERVLQLDPDHVVAVEHLLGAMVGAGASRRHVAWLEARAATSRNPFELGLVALALLDAGREGAAVATWQKKGGLQGTNRIEPQYARFLILSGRAPEAEVGVRRALADLPPDALPRQVAYWRSLLAVALVAQGRFVEAASVADAPGESPVSQARLRMSAAVAGGDADGFRAAVREFEALKALDDPGELVGVLLLVASVGDRHLGRSLAEKAAANPLVPDMGAVERAALDPLVSWGMADSAAAQEGFRRMTTVGHVAGRFWGHAILGILASERGDCAEAVAEIEAAWGVGYSYGADDRAVVQPILLRHLASCHEKLGSLARAQEWNDELLRRLARADPGIPLLADARARRARLAVTSSR